MTAIILSLLLTPVLTEHFEYIERFEGTGIPPFVFCIDGAQVGWVRWDKQVYRCIYVMTIPNLKNPVYELTYELVMKYHQYTDKIYDETKADTESWSITKTHDEKQKVDKNLPMLIRMNLIEKKILDHKKYYSNVTTRYGS